jgi:hypothetical protein
MMENLLAWFFYSWEAVPFTSDREPVRIDPKLLEDVYVEREPHLITPSRCG